jgi:hypothetical protein
MYKAHKPDCSGAAQSARTNGMVFVYPIHGGYLGDDATVLLFGTYTTYDSLAPQFNTYGTIKYLAQKKSP